MLYVLIFIILLIIFLVWFYFIDLFISLIYSKVPYVWTFNEQLEMLKKLSLQKWKSIIDLWCWDGKALRFFEKQFWLKWIWYDINLYAILYGKILNKIHKSNIKIINGDFLKQDISVYDYIYVYLLPEFLGKIEDWIFTHKKKDTIIISTAFTFKNHKSFQIINWKIYLYK